MTNSTWCGLNFKGDILKLHDTSPNLKCNCQKVKTFTTHQYLLEGGSIKKKLQKMFKGTQTAWNKFFKPALSIASPYIDMAVSAKTKNPKVGQAAGTISKLLSGGKILGLTDMHGRGLGSKVM